MLIFRTKQQTGQRNLKTMPPPPHPSRIPIRTWNPLRRFCPLLPAWWAHIRNQRILNGYITGIIRRRWDLIQKEKLAAAAAATAAADGTTNGVGNGDGIGRASKGGGGGEVSQGRRRDILDKVLDSLEEGEWGPAAVLQVRAVIIVVGIYSYCCILTGWLSLIFVR